MLAYCGNNPINNSDPNGSRIVGAGVQVEADTGSSTCGCEIVIYWDETVVESDGYDGYEIAIYTYGGFSVELNSISVNAIADIILENQAMLGNGTEDFVSQVSSIISKTTGISGSVFVVDGNDSFRHANDYAGPFDTVSVSNIPLGGARLKAYYSASKSCTVVGFGAVATVSAGISVSYGYSEYFLWSQGNFSQGFRYNSILENLGR